MSAPLTDNMLAVFGALRAADERELDTTQLAKRTGLPWRAAVHGAVGLRKRRLARSRRCPAHTERLWSLANGS